MLLSLLLSCVVIIVVILCCYLLLLSVVLLLGYNTVLLLYCSPQDVLATLLNNLKVQERQNRVCTTVAIAIVAETCSPFTVLPALMNEYRVPELNVQNGVLKSLSFLFEYIGEMGKDYIYAVTPLLEDALMDRYSTTESVVDIATFLLAATVTHSKSAAAPHNSWGNL